MTRHLRKPSQIARWHANARSLNAPVLRYDKSEARRMEDALAAMMATEGRLKATSDQHIQSPEALDACLIEALDNGPATSDVLAMRVHASHPTVTARLRNLRAKGILKGERPGGKGKDASHAPIQWELAKKRKK